MASHTRLFVVIAGLAAALAASMSATGQCSAPDPDSLYADRIRLDSAVGAAAIWEQRLGGGAADFEAAWKLARAAYWLGSHAPTNQRRKQLERGIEAATRAVAIDGSRPEGHFWLAADMGTLAESFGLRAGLRYRGPVKRELETVLRIDPGYGEGLADRALGRWYLRVPALFGGSRTLSVQHLQHSLLYDARSAATHLFLAETYLAMGRREDADQELQQVLDAPEHPDWVPEVQEFKQRAATLRAPLHRR